MSEKHNHKLEELTNNISHSLENQAESSCEYMYSTSLMTPKARQLAGIWRVTEHTVNGVPYAEVFASNSLKDTDHDRLTYEATYEFGGNLCIKRVLIYGDIIANGEKEDYEYRMSMVLTWELGHDTISVLPVLAYQCSSIDGSPVSVRELPHSNFRIELKYTLDANTLILEDGTDVKKLERNRE